MHIADGILPVTVCVAGYALSLAGSAWGSRRLEAEEVPRMGMLAAATFVASTIHFPIAGTSVHFGLFGLLGMMLGLRALPVGFAVLLLQAFLFQHGGFLTLGVNAFNMGVGTLCGAALGRIHQLPLTLRSFLAGFLGMLVPAALMIAEFQLAAYGRSLLLLGGIYALIGVAEGVFTMSVTLFLQRVRPGLLMGSLVPQPVVISRGGRASQRAAATGNMEGVSS
jgi:cobalt/nickel transport system permease protein